jgi:hypothetical protein
MRPVQIQSLGRIRQGVTRVCCKILSGGFGLVLLALHEPALPRTGSMGFFKSRKAPMAVGRRYRSLLREEVSHFLENAFLMRQVVRWKQIAKLFE